MGTTARDRNVAWGLTWVVYASYYLGRKGFSVVKKKLHDELGVSEAALGLIDTLYLSTYALGQFGSGVIGDRIGARRLLGYGLLLCAAFSAGFGLSNAALGFGLAFCLNGFAQSTGWPGTTRAMAEWTTPRNRGTVMSFWATCYQVGGIVASVVAGYLLKHHGWRWVFIVPAIWLGLLAVIVLLVLKPGPAPTEAVVVGASGRPPIEAETDRLLAASAQQALLRNPVLWFYGASYFFIKFIRYAVLFWMPYYLAKRQGYAEDVAAYVSTAFEVGGIAGVIAIGTISDRVPRGVSRSLLAAASLVFLAFALLAYNALSTSVGGSVLGLTLVGAALFGPDSLISGAAAQDAGGARAAATATGFVNGLGSIGAILEGLFVPWLSRNYGWQALFPVLVGLAVLAALCLVPTFRMPGAARA